MASFIGFFIWKETDSKKKNRRVWEIVDSSPNRTYKICWPNSVRRPSTMVPKTVVCFSPTGTNATEWFVPNCRRSTFPSAPHWMNRWTWISASRWSLTSMNR